MKNLSSVLFLFLLLHIACSFAYAQCPAGEVEVIFTLDMTCADTDLRPPVVTGPFNGFSGDGNIMIDPDGDDIWEAIICAVPGSTFEYKYAILNFADQENLIDDAIGGAPCNYNTNFFDFSNRLVTIPAGGGPLPIDTYGICGTCDNPPINVTFTINMNCSDVPAGTQVAMFGLFNGFCCPYNLEDPDGDNIWTTTLPFPPDENGCITMEYLYMSPGFSNVESFLTNGEDLANCPNINTDFYNFANRIITVCADTVLDDYWNTCFAPEEPAGGCDDTICDNGLESWDGCECVTAAPVFGCTDATANNYDPNANCDDNSCTFDLCDDPCAPNFEGPAPCLPYDMTCNDDCTIGPFGGIWDTATCSCINETTPIVGCIDAAYCEFNPAANCDDNSCVTLNTDPGTCDDGDCTNGFEIWDTQSCTCIPDPTVLPVLGCTDASACNYNPSANCDDPNDPCLPFPQCNTDGCAGDLEIPDPINPCNCIVDQPQLTGCSSPEACNYDPLVTCDGACDFGNPACADPCNEIFGCTDSAACNFNPGACVDDGTCQAPPCNPGCTDPCAGNYDPNADEDDGSCNPYDDTCNADCTAGPFGGTWDAATCSCINETTPVNGCTDSSACNYNPSANCDDNSCDFGNTTCIDPCNPTTGCMDDTACNYNPNACEDDGSCEAPPCNPGCTDPCAGNYDPNADEDDGSCNQYDMTCNTDCTIGDIEIWDITLCSCVIDIPTILGCTNPDACNYDPNANCDDLSCDNGGNTDCIDPCNPIFGCTDDNACNYNPDACVDDGSCELPPCNPGCTNPCADNYDPNADEDDGTCNPYNDTCNMNCVAGPFGGIWDETTCTCINEIIPINGCTDALASNYDPAANCDDGTCYIPCEDEIAGTINTDMTCDVSGIAVLITDVTGNPIGIAIADANGNYALSGGPFPCGEYIATLDAASVPACYTNVEGDVGPSGFVVDGDGNADGANFSSFNEVPTLSQWGLMVLALLLMTFGVLKLGFQNFTNEASKLS